MMQQVKTCSKCKRDLPRTIEYFEPRKESKDGFRNQCKDCRNKNRRKIYKDKYWKGTQWTEREIQILKKYYTDTDTLYIHNNLLPNRSISQITDYATKVLELKKKPNRRIHRITNNRIYGWTYEEEQYLIDNYSLKNKTELETKLNKQWKTIQARATLLGIREKMVYSGVAKISVFLRRRLSVWKRESLRYYDNKCWITGEEECQLEIHHVVNFNSIVADIVKELDLPTYDNISSYSENELNDMVDLCMSKHREIGYGIPMKTELHKLFHSKYGYKQNNYEQLVEFKQLYLKGVVR